MAKLEKIRKLIRQNNLADESQILRELIEQTNLSKQDRATIADNGAELVRRVRINSDPTLMENFLGEFGLSTSEGIALMCLAEALLRIPDAETVDALIADKISSSDWDSHMGKASSSLVNASTWALMLTGRVLSSEDDQGLINTLQNLIRRMGEPVIRTAVAQAMKELGRQFVLGETIENAQTRGRAMQNKGYTYSFDMLGEAAINDEDARRYHLAYADAITEIAKNTGKGIRDNPGISVKLSALHPRYEFIQKPRMFEILVSRFKSLAMLAARSNIGLNIDAEEAARLDISLDVMEAVLSDPSFADWDGFGVVVQAYSKRAADTIDWLYQLAEMHQRKIMVRLVKGAYWDSEIKEAQVLGLTGFPVFTRKENTDICYIACAKKLLSMGDRIYPQFATHNAHSVAAIRYLAGSQNQSYEFQRLHGMGEALMQEIMSGGEARCRIYAPVGAHKDLLAYLVRRLLENGANSSFVHQIVDETIPAEAIAADPFEAVIFPTENPNIPLAANLFGNQRLNSHGLDINDPVDLELIEKDRASYKQQLWHATPLLAGASNLSAAQPVFNPALLSEQVGSLQNTDRDDLDEAVKAARKAQPAWSRATATSRANILNKAADLYEAHADEFFSLLAREAGKTIADCIGELREAVDFLRFYANETERLETSGTARGIFTCISPWNFPLAIFTGQIAAALGAGNAVLAKPAEQTSIIAWRATQLLHQAGIPEDILQLLPGAGAIIGNALTSNREIDGVCFTGSTATARIINQNMARNLPPDAPLIAETGGINVMIVDSSALPQQAVKDVLTSAFQSAGQRCSACRLLYLQSDIAEEFLTMLRGAMDTLKIGNPWEVDTDIGPLIDRDAYREIASYAGINGRNPDDNFLLAPSIKRVSGIDEIEREIFGPVLHVATYEASDLDQIVDRINARGYGLTFGLHTRIDSRVDQVTRRIQCGNIYINRNQIGAIVGSQPFGGEGLSGTGPKAGGPNYLQRFKRHDDGVTLPDTYPTGAGIPVAEIQDAIVKLSKLRILKRHELEKLIENSGFKFPEFSNKQSQTLPGPTGESNVLSYAPKGLVLCLGPTSAQAGNQAVAALAAGCQVIVLCEKPPGQLAELQRKGAPIRCIGGHVSCDDITKLKNLSVVTIQPCEAMADLRAALAARAGTIVPIASQPYTQTSFLHERHTCIDTTAAGGNAALMVEAG
ncbi:MAG: bifunctional proline dehydrogenase/L-glutamate gamma-semialdehyde dehydrogenase PutA [Hyphomicrobiales bacterium]|nr:bifunctional proline dehydrogenase/L-glutamate gamma-semialdehyde dehydrogenase PutA [Hyphomicrobiales bacterium]